MRKRQTLRLRLAFAAAVALFSAAIASGTPALAEPLRATIPPNIDCSSLMRAPRRGGGLVTWQSTVAMEHCDRIKRLWRLSSYAAYGAPPEFFDGYVEADKLPTDIGVRMPILRVVFPERVFFDTAQSTLRPEAMEVVRIIARNLQMEPPDVVLFVAGHADARGDRDYNLNLSVDRANAIAEAIMREGVNVASVWRVGFGEDMPLVPGDTLEAYGQNRRVEFLFAGRPEVVANWMADEQLDMLCQGRTRGETNSCRASLDLRNEYVVTEVSAPAPVDLSPQRPGGQVGPTQQRTVLQPTPTRRIVINPTNRHAGPVQTP